MADDGLAMPQHKTEAHEDRKRAKELAEARQSGKVGQRSWNRAVIIMVPLLNAASFATTPNVCVVPSGAGRGSRLNV